MSKNRAMAKDKTPLNVKAQELAYLVHAFRHMDFLNSSNEDWEKMTASQVEYFKKKRGKIMDELRK